jgi:hypothetical protein
MRQVGRRVRRGIRWLAGRIADAAGAGPAPPDLELARAARPVLLLHGVTSSAQDLDVLARRLRRDGHAPIVPPAGGLRGALSAPGIDDLALRLRETVERLYARHPSLAPLAIVAHARGGLVACHYVKHLGGWRRVRAVVTLGTPHRGTPAALAGLPLGVLGRSVWQMVPGMPFLRRLAEGPWPGTVRLASVWSRTDAVVPFPAAVVETHGLSHLANVEVEARHGQLLTAKRVYEAVRRELRAAEEGAPVRRGALAMMRGGRTRAPRAPAVHSPPCETGAGTTSTTGRSSR